MTSTTQSGTSAKNIADVEAFRGQHPRRTTIEVRPDWKTEFGKVKFCEQRQDALLEQLKDLVHVANRLGFYDAADFLNERTKQ